MRTLPDRLLLTVFRHEGLWQVELEGEAFGHSPDREIARAAANRRVLELLQRGQPCEVRVQGERSLRPA